MNDDLSLITTEDLICELERRSECYIFAAILKADQREARKTRAVFYYEGGYYNALGLAEQIRYDLLANSDPLTEKPPIE